ncbi:MAG: DNA-directed RNA polymerase subunit beta [Lachnospiraceae bacterium]|nr:DNA-directed RNA polymerase subunit beta [Lachnospiraceae bacterium]
MDKNRMRPIVNGGVERMSYASQKEVLEIPNLLDVQKVSYDWFLHQGLKEVFDDFSPIEDKCDHYSLEFASFVLDEKDAKHTIDQCKDRDLTYEAPLKVKVRLFNKQKEEIKEHEVFMGNFPLMTETGTFVINGAERVIVSQLVRSPGIYCTNGQSKDKKHYVHNCQIIPYRGGWLECETDANDPEDPLVIGIDKNKSLMISVFLRAIGYGTNEEIIDLFGEEPKLMKSLEKDKARNYEEGLKELYSVVRKGEPFSMESAEKYVSDTFFDVKRYELAKVGRYMFNKKLALKNRIAGYTFVEDVIDPLTGEVIAKAGTVATVAIAEEIQNAGVQSVTIAAEDKNIKVISNLMVDINEWCDVDAEALGVNELVYFPVLTKILQECEDKPEKLASTIKENIASLIPRHITKSDIVSAINYALCLEHKVGQWDDIDHLGNRRVRTVGELLQNQFRIGLSRMERVVKERMNANDSEDISPQALINIKPVQAAIKEFFGSSQLSQFMDQTNPLSEITNKRRLSALGPGGLNRENAKLEVRDIHYTHYGRMCPIESPEGQNIGLIGSLAVYARVNEYGFVEAPYRKIDKKDPSNPVVTDEVVYMTADVEDNYYIAQASAKIDEKGRFLNEKVAGRHRNSTGEYRREKFDFMDVSPKMVFSAGTELIPFLQNDDPTRALMGANMQRQAVPLLVTEAPVVGTGLETKVAVDSGACVVAKNAGEVTYVSSELIKVKLDKGGVDEYKLHKYVRSNQSNCYNQKPIVFKGNHIEAGQVIADGPSTHNGELSLGRNPLIGFMTWEGYNYEDAVLLSENLVKEDVYTSIHIEKYEVDARDTKNGPEEITRDIANVGERAKRDLDERGIIRIGAEVRAGDYLVGKVMPKGENDSTLENGYNRLINAVNGDKAKSMKDVSLKVPHGAYGTVVDVKVFSRAEGDTELNAGVNMKVRVYIAQKRKIGVGDKMAGRHGNKGVVSRVLPVEDMPYLPNGRPLDIVLNPLGVPSRMNIGQVLETHLSLAAKVLGFNISTPVFDGANEKDIEEALELANDYANDEWSEFTKKHKAELDPAVFKSLEANKEYRQLWKGVPISKEGKVELRDGRTGEKFDSLVTIGHMHYLKLHHLVDDKIHARSTGNYTRITQQPLGGKAQFGGQRFGEMEVWALEAYGAAYTLQEVLTVRSDDIAGRNATLCAIQAGENIPKASVPESFKVMLNQLKSLSLDVKLLDENDEEIEMKEAVDDYRYPLDKLSFDTPKVDKESMNIVDAEGNTVEDTEVALFGENEEFDEDLAGIGEFEGGEDEE